MRFKITLSKSANHFFFISNLTEWHFSCRKKYNQAWLMKTGTLTLREKMVLRDFKKILTKYGFTWKRNISCYLGRFFLIYPKTEVWERLKNAVTKKEYKTIERAFDTFQPRFGKIWKESDRNARIKLFQRSLRGKRAKTLFKDVERIFGIPREDRMIDIVVLLSPLDHKETAAGSANIGPSHITLELPELKPNTWQLAYSLCLLGHEVSHLLWEERGGRKLIAAVIKSKGLPSKLNNIHPETLSVINELMIESFLPIGYLGQKYFPEYLPPLLFENLDKGLSAINSLRIRSRSTAEYYSDLKYYLIWKLYPYAVYYAHRKKKVDEQYVSEAAEILQDFH